MNIRPWVAAVTLLAGAGAAHAQSVTYDFKGTGELCTAAQPGSDFICESDVQFTGSVTMQVLDPNPGGPDGESNGVTDAWAENGWVQNSFVIRWGDQTFIPGPLPDMRLSESFTEVSNGFAGRADFPLTDMLYNSVFYSSDLCIQSVQMIRSTTDMSWLDGIDFDLSATLAPGADATNTLDFESGPCGTSPEHRYGNVTLTSLTPRATRVKIDIRPHADPNYINPKSAGFVPVAILGSGEFDATQVDPRWARFGPRHARAVDAVRIADVNRDGFPDAVLRFRIRDTGICPKQHAATLTGRTFAGERFLGVDRIRIAGK
jgi:hypothetical protein